MSYSTAMTPTAEHHENSEDIDLLDMLTVMAEHLKLLIFGPLIVGLTAFLLSLWLPRSFESVSILDAEKTDFSIAPSAIVSLAASANLLETVALDLEIATDAPKAARLAQMSQRVSASVGRQDKLITLRTLGRSPEQAQQLNAAVWKHLLPLTAPRGTEKLRLQEQLSAEQARLAAGNKLEQVSAQQLQDGHVTDNLSRLYGELLTANGSSLRTITSLQARLEGLSTDDLIQTPTLPGKALKPKPALVAVIAALTSGMLLLLFVFVRHAWQSAHHQPEQAAKIARLQAALRKER
jgi:hypothetical protein